MHYGDELDAVVCPPSGTVFQRSLKTRCYVLPQRARVTQVLVNRMELMGVHKYIYVGFILEQYGCNGKQLCSHFVYYYL